jgi:hypothetical protein
MAMKKILPLPVAWLIAATAFGQVGIGTANPNGAAQLDVSSNSKGFLFPRMTYAQKEAISTPVQGLMVYCTDCGTNGQAQIYNGAAWTNLIGGTPNGLPVVTTSSITILSSTTASGGGNVSFDGGLPVTARGIVWSATINPPVLGSSSYTSNGTDTGTYTSSLTGLTSGTLYRVRSYATNSVGTAYGNTVTFTAGYFVGKTELGGKIAYVDNTEIHGLIAAVSDVSSAAIFGCQGTNLPGAEGTAIGTGSQNTTDIVNACPTAGIAARLCYDLVEGGYSDWYLPSRDELNKLYENRVAIGNFTTSESEITMYWSSTENTNNPLYTAWVQFFSHGIQSPDRGKDGNAIRVRCVRSF